MRFATYFCDAATEPRFGFKKDNYIVDIINCTKWFNEQYKRQLFLRTPSSLKEALGNWKVNFEKLKELDSAISQTNLIEMTQGENPIALHESEITLLAPVPNPKHLEIFTPLNNTFDQQENSEDLKCILIGLKFQFSISLTL